MKNYTFKQLCQSLAETEYFLRNGGAKVNTSIKNGRSDQLKYMELNFPTQFEKYCTDLLDRLAKPFDKETLLAPIKNC